MTKDGTIKHLHEALDSVDITFPYRYVLVEAIEILSQFSTPSNLNEAAEVGWDAYYNSDKFPSDPCSQSGYKTGFKAGAEWMTGQGISAKSKVCKLAERAWVTAVNEKQLQHDIYDNFADGDEVIVQIRKK